jgi:hypothetical protein
VSSIVCEQQPCLTVQELKTAPLYPKPAP